MSTKGLLPADRRPKGTDDATSLTELDARSGSLIAAARSQRTLKAYEKDLVVFNEWCGSHGLQSMPASVDTVRRFLTDQLATLKPSTVSRRLVAVNVAHHFHGLAKPGDAFEIRELMKGARRLAARKAADDGTKVTKQAKELLRDDLIAILPPIGSTKLVDIRDRALLLVGFAGAMRRSELESLTVSNMERLDDGDCVRFHLPQTKTSQETGQDRDVCRGSNPSSDPIAALDRWLEATGIASGSVFRSVLGRNGTKVSEKALSGRSVDRIVRERCADAGLHDLNNPLYSAHSLRSGFATQARTDGNSMLEIGRAGGWADNSAVVANYVRAGDRSGIKVL